MWFNIPKFYKSLSPAIRGLWIVTKENNFRIQIGVMLLVLIQGFYFSIRSIDWIFIFIAILFVLVAEIVNTSIEKLCDVCVPEKHEGIRNVKDLAAGAVLIASVFSILIGVLVFSKYWIRWLVFFAY